MAIYLYHRLIMSHIFPHLIICMPILDIPNISYLSPLLSLYLIFRLILQNKNNILVIRTHPKITLHNKDIGYLIPLYGD
jgi:hypothetical protein